MNGSFTAALLKPYVDNSGRYFSSRVVKLGKISNVLIGCRLFLWVDGCLDGHTVIMKIYCVKDVITVHKLHLIISF